VANQSLTNTRAQRTKNREILKKAHTNEKTQGQHEQQQSNKEKTKDSTHSSNQNPTTEPASRNNIDLGAKVAKHPPNNQLWRQSIRPEQLEPTRRLRQSIRQRSETRTKCDPDDAGTEAENSPRRVDDRHQQGFQDNASRKETTPQAPSLSDQHGLGFHLEGKQKREKNGGRMTPSKR